MFELLIIALIAFVVVKFFTRDKGESNQAARQTFETFTTGVSESAQRAHQEWEQTKFEARVESIMSDPALVARIIEEDQIRSQQGHEN